MDNLKVGLEGKIALPGDLRARYLLTPDTQVRVIETQSGILLVPLTGQPMSPRLITELAAWQSMSAQSWEHFPYEEVPV